MKAVNIQKRISELEHENNVLKQTIAGYEQKLSQKCSNEEFLKAESVNKDLELAKQELEQYKSHLEEVIKERTVELKNSEMRFLTLSDSLSGGAIFEITLTKEDIPWIGYMSKTTSSLLEFDLNLMRDNLGAFYERIYPDDLPIFNQAFTLSKETKCEFNVEVRFITPSNKIKWLHFKANAIEQTNNYTVWVGIIIDTTQKNIFQQEIQEREAILNAIIENIPYDFWARDAQLRCFLQNSASKRLWGNIIGTLPEELPVNETDKNLLQQLMFRVKQGEIVNEEIQMTDKHGSLYDFQTLIAPILLQGKIQGVLGLNIDITDRKQVEKALIQNEEKFRNIFDSSTDAIVIHTIDGIIIEMNKEFQKLLQLTSVNVVLDLHILIPIVDFELFKTNIINNCNCNATENVLFETELELKNNQKIPIEIKSKEIDYLGSKAILSLIQNTTYRKKFERQLVTAIVETEERERARFASDLHDDLGPILSSMKMLTGLLVDTKDFDTIKNISNQLYELVSESIRSVRETSNSISPHILKNYGIVAATRNIIQSFQHSIDIQITTNCESVRFESTTEVIYYRVMRELLHNTIKHAQATQVTIQLQYKKNILQLEYKDNGIGFNVDEKLQENSTGLGLYNIISRIKSLEAKYSLKSSPQKGVHFILETKIPN